MIFIDGTVVNVALPVLQRQFHAPLGAVQWVVESYALCLAACMLVGGTLADRFGRRRMFAAGVVVFAAASAACGAAPALGPLIAARAAQGIGGALLAPGSLAIISSTFEGDARGRAIGTWSGATAILAGVGPVAGGWLVDHASWRWAFWLNLPLAAVTLLVLLTCVPESRDPDAAGPLDVAGAALATVGLAGVVHALLQSGSDAGAGRDRWIAMALGLAALAAFVVRESRARSPMLPLALFRSRTFAGANLLTLLLYAALGGALFFLPFKLIQVDGASPTAAGAALLPFIAIMFGLSRWAGGLVGRYGARLPLVVGPSIAAAGFLLFAAGPGVRNLWLGVLPAVALLGLGMTVAVAPLTTTVMSAVPDRFAGIASGISNTASRVASVLAIAVLGVVLLAAFGRALERELAAVPLPPAARAAIAAQRSRLADIELPASVPDEARARVRRAVGGAFAAGFRLVMLLAAAMAIGAALAAWRMIEPHPQPAMSISARAVRPTDVHAVRHPTHARRRRS